MERIQIDKIKVLRVCLVVAVLIACLAILKIQPWNISGKNPPANSPQEITIPSIVNGNLVLPKLATPSAVSSLFGGQGLGVVSANLFPIFDQQSQKMTGIRIIGEISNPSDKTVGEISPIIKFYDADNRVLGQKIAQLSSDFTFLGAEPQATTIYDVTVSDPPVSDKLEITVNAAATVSKLDLEPLLIASRSMEVKSAVYQGNQGPVATNSNQSSGSAVASASGEQVEYYSVSGSVVNGLTDPVTDISVYAWVKDKDNKIFALAKQDFKNDLLQPNDKLDFRILLLPLKNGEHYETYGLVAKGKRYKLNL